MEDLTYLEEEQIIFACLFDDRPKMCTSTGDTSGGGDDDDEEVPPIIPD